MKYDVSSSVIQMKEETFKQLVTEVKETVAIVDFPEQKKQSFGLIDMWNIRRNAISANSLMKR